MLTSLLTNPDWALRCAADFTSAGALSVPSRHRLCEKRESFGVERVLRQPIELRGSRCIFGGMDPAVPELERDAAVAIGHFARSSDVCRGRC